MFQIKDLTITHAKDNRVLLSGFSFVLHPGDRVVCIGEEGNGKSTLLKWMADPKALYALLHAVGLKEDFPYRDQVMRTLSGGEKVKAQMTRLLLKEPTMLLLDEPSNDIDIETLEWLERMIRETKAGVLYISHDETLIENTATRVIHIEQLKRKQAPKVTIANMPYAQYVTERRDAFSRQTQLALNERREEKKQMARFHRIEQSVEYALRTVGHRNPGAGALLKKKMKAVKSLERRYERELLARKDLHAVYMPQNYNDLLEMDFTPVEYLAPSGDKEEVTRIRTYLGAMKYTADEMSHPIRDLSGGQKAKILLLKMSVSAADVLLLDEPTRNFSPLSGPVIRQMLHGFPGAILSVSHDRKYIEEVCDKVYRLTENGLEEVSDSFDCK